MDLATFQVCAERTMTDPNNEHRMLNAALGICGEAAEIAAVFGVNDTDLLEECGDLMWYVAQMCKAHNTSIEHLAPRHASDNVWSDEEFVINQLWRDTGHIADMIKKLVFHKKPLVNVVFFDTLRRVVTEVDALLGFTGKHLADACEHNNQKLLKRHANGFSYASANAYADRQS